MTIREIGRPDFPHALALVQKVFMRFEAPDYGEEGVAEFQRSIADPTYLGQLRMYGAYAGDRLAGVLATRGGGAHIALFFVDEAYQRRGIGRALFMRACADSPSGTMRVNASPYAVAIYRRRGFAETDAEQNANGIRYTPMAYTPPKL